MRRKRETVYLTRDTVEHRMLLAPDPQLSERLLGVLGRALRLYPLDLHAFVFLADRIEMMVTVRSKPRLAGFLGHLYRNVSCVVGAFRGWERGVFAGRGTQERVTTAKRAQDLFVDIHALPVTRGLVGRAEEWPGLSSAAAHLGGIDLVGVWNRDSYHVPISRLPARFGTVDIDERFADIVPPARAMGRHWVLACEPTLPDPRSPEFAELLEAA